jgi:hypothetical protein
MVDLDLDILSGKKKTIKLGGQVREFKDLTMNEFMEAELIVQTLESAPLANEESIAEIKKLKNAYLVMILEIEPEEAEQITMVQYKALRKFQARQDLYDQGFSDRDIDMIEKKSVKKQMAQIR